MLQERKQENSRRSLPGTAINCGRCYFVSDVVFTFTTSYRIGDIAGQRSGDKATKLLQQGLHLTLHSYARQPRIGLQPQALATRQGKRRGREGAGG